MSMKWMVGVCAIFAAAAYLLDMALDTQRNCFKTAVFNEALERTVVERVCLNHDEGEDV